jgi:hypothetical protein
VMGIAANSVNIVHPNSVTAYQACDGLGQGSLLAAAAAGVADGAITAIVETSLTLSTPLRPMLNASRR